MLRVRKCAPNIWAMSQKNVDFAHPIFRPYFMYCAPNLRLLPPPLYHILFCSQGTPQPCVFRFIASHPVFRNDLNLAIFLEYDKELNVRGKNKKERLFDVFSSMQKSGDELLLSNTGKSLFLRLFIHFEKAPTYSKSQ